MKRISRALNWQAAGQRLLFQIENSVFTERHIYFYGTSVVAGSALAVLLWWGFNWGVWVVHPDGTLSSIDFCWMWMSAKFAASPDPSRLFQIPLLSAAKDIFHFPGECDFPNRYGYPPTFLFFVYPLSSMSYLVAFTVWVVATFFLYEATVYAIVPRAASLIAAATPGVIVKNVQLGHTGFIVASLIGLSLLFMERRPWLAGIFIGLLTCKPQYGVLFPLALLGARDWRAFGSATATSILLATGAAIAFGAEGWPSFFELLSNRNASLSADAEVELKLQSIFGLLHSAGATTWVSWGGQLAAASLIGAAVYSVWAKPNSHSLRAAILCIGAVTVTPYVLAYDLCILSIGAAFLVKDGLVRGFLPGERTVILISSFALFFPATPTAPFICAALLLLVSRRIVVKPFAREKWA